MQGITLIPPVHGHTWKRCGYGRVSKQTTDPLLAVADAGIPAVRKTLKRALLQYQQDIGKAVSFLMGNPERPISLYEVTSVIDMVAYHLNQSTFSIPKSGPAPPWSLFKASPNEDEQSLGEVLNLRAAVAAADAVNEAVFGVGEAAVKVFDRRLLSVPGAQGTTAIRGLVPSFTATPVRVLQEARVAGFGQVRFLDMYEEGVQAMRAAMVRTMLAAADSDMAGIAGVTGSGGLVGELRRILPEVAQPTYGLLPSQVERANRYLSDMEKQAFRDPSKLGRVTRRYNYPTLVTEPPRMYAHSKGSTFITEQFKPDLSDRPFFDLGTTNPSGGETSSVLRNRVGVRGRNRDILFDKKSGRTVGRVGAVNEYGKRPVDLDAKGRRWLAGQRVNAGPGFVKWQVAGGRSAWKRALSRELDIRVERIARTETIRVANAGYLAGVEDAVNNGMLPIRTRLVWETTDDDRLCSICAPMGGQLQEVGGTFEATQRVLPSGESVDLRNKWQGRHPPLHPNCRCKVSEYLPDLEITDEDLRLPTGGVPFADPGPGFFPDIPPELRGDANFQGMMRDVSPDEGSRKLTTRAVAIMSTILRKPPKLARGNVEIRYAEDLPAGSNGMFQSARIKPGVSDAPAYRHGPSAPPTISIQKQVGDVGMLDADALDSQALQTFFHEYGHRIDYQNMPGAPSHQLASSRFELLKKQYTTAFQELDPSQIRLLSGEQISEMVLERIRRMGPLSVADTPEMAFFVKAQNSNSFQLMVKAINSGDLRLQSTEKMAALAYVTNPVEVWARAFHQWTVRQAVKSPADIRNKIGGALRAVDDDLIDFDTDELIDLLDQGWDENYGGFISTQWQAAEFDRDIAPLVEEVLTEWGLL